LSRREFPAAIARGQFQCLCRQRGHLSPDAAIAAGSNSWLVTMITSSNLAQAQAIIDHGCVQRRHISRANGLVARAVTGPQRPVSGI